MSKPGSDGSVMRRGETIATPVLSLYPCAVATWQAALRRWRIDVTVDVTVTTTASHVEMLPGNVRRMADVLAQAAGAAELLGVELRKELAAATFEEPPQ